MSEYGYGLKLKLERAIEHIKELESKLGGGTASQDSPFKGKIVAAVGDSITADGSYTNPLKTLLGATSMINAATGGAGHTGGGFENSVAGVNGTVNLWVVAGGVNDFRLSNTLGSISDCFVDSNKTDNDIGNNTFYAAFYRTLRKVAEKFPAAKCVVATPYNNPETTYGASYPKWNKKNAQGFTLYDYAKAMREVATLWGFPVADVNAESGINFYTDSKYLYDGIHANATGGYAMAQVIYSKIMQTPYFSLP